MSTMTQLAKYHLDHDPHANDQSNPCDACRLLELVEKHREAMKRVLEWTVKGQWDQGAFSAALLEGLGR